MAEKSTYEELERLVRELDQAKSERDQAQLSLRESEDRYRKLIDFSPLPFLVTQGEKIVFANLATARILGTEHQDEIIGSAPTDWIRSDFAAQAYHRRCQAMEAGESLDPVELVLVRKDNKEKVVIANTTRISHLGSPALLSVFQDITERKREEEERRLNEARLEALLKLNDIKGSDSVDLSLFALEESARLTGSDIGFINFLSRDEHHVTHAVYTRNTLAQCNLPDEVSAFEISGCGLWSEAYRRRQPIVVNDYTEGHANKIGFPSGHPLLRRFVSIPIFEQDRVVAVAALGNKQEPYNSGDIRQFRLFMEGLWQIIQRRQTVAALRESERRFRELAELLPETIYEMDLEGTLTFVNQSAFEKFGYSKRDFELGLKAFDMISRKDRARAKENYKKIVQGETVGISEYEAQRKDKTTFPALCHSTAIQRNGDIVGLRGFILDITQEKQLESQLKQSQKMEAIGTLAGGIAHDFNNILSIVVGNIELAILDVPEWSPAQDNLKEVREATLRARELVKQILMFARQKEHTVSNIRMEPLAKESLKMLRASMPTTVDIRENIEEGLPNVLADPSQIQQIIMNLCTNAGQVMEAEGGTLTFTLDVADLKAPLHTVLEDLPPGGYVRMQVRDTGPGIPAENLERIFDPFFTTKGVGEGTGLGLAVVHGIVQDRKGGIMVESDEGRGTTFSIYLPASEVESVEVTAEEKMDLPRGTEWVLFVDDEPMIMKLGQQMLKRQGYKVETRASGTDALKCFSQDPHRFDLVVTDMTMPGMRGDRLAEEILAIRSDIPVILCTGYSRQISKKKAQHIGIRAFVMKPLTQYELANTVRRVLDETPRKKF